MKSLLLSLGLGTALLSITNFAASIKSSTNLVNNTTNQLSNSEQYAKELATTMDLEISNNNEEQIKQIVLNSLFIVNNQVCVNTNSFVNLQDLKIKNLFIDANFEKTIQKMYENKMLVLNEEVKFVFTDFKVQFEKTGVWVEKHWYWFGYWKLHLDHQSSISMNYILDAASSGTDIAYAISGWFPISGVILAAFSVFSFANSLIFNLYDHGKGVWIGWFIVIPDMGWDSNK